MPGAEYATSSHPPVPPIQRMAVRPHPQGWALRVDGIEEPAWVLESRDRAVAAARSAAAFHGCPLDVYDRTDALTQTLRPSA